VTEIDEKTALKAVKELEELIIKYPDNSKPYYYLAFIYLKTEREKSLKILKEGIKKAPAGGELHSLAGLIYFEDKSYKKALELLLEAERLCPSPQKELYKTIGETCFKLERYDDAASYYLKIADMGEEISDMLFYAADCYRKSLKWNACEMVINRALKVSPHVKFHNLLAFLSVMRFNFQRAFAIYDKIMELDAKCIPQALFNKGFTYMIMGNYKKSIEIWEELSKKYPERADFHYSAGVINYMSENKEGAIKYFKLCIEKDCGGKLAKKAEKRLDEVKNLL